MCLVQGVSLLDHEVRRHDDASRHGECVLHDPALLLVLGSAGHQTGEICLLVHPV